MDDVEKVEVKDLLTGNDFEFDKEGKAPEFSVEEMEKWKKDN